MPDVARRQQKGFKVDSFEYKKMSAMRFVGRESDDLANVEVRKELFSILDALNVYKLDLDYDVLFMHHYGQGEYSCAMKSQFRQSGNHVTSVCPHSNSSSG
jgi:hypothetical protein